MKEVIQNSMLPLVIRMADDPVPNIRFNVAKTLYTLIKYLDTTVRFSSLSCLPLALVQQPPLTRMPIVVSLNVCRLCRTK
jgi:serine/threonine-protein phosphatase 2A regulatory subunit A